MCTVKVNSNFAPIALFVYDRPIHTKFVIDSLKSNAESIKTDLIIFSDGPKTDSNLSNVNLVRRYLRTVDGFKSIKIVEKEFNCGLSKSIIYGVTEVLQTYEKIIVLEDDLVVSKFFIQYMNACLHRYQDNDNVISIHGYVYPVVNKLPETFFLPGADCWGWATWRRGWKLFNPNGTQLLNELKRLGKCKEFDFNGSFPYTKMLTNQIDGKNDSWAVRWYASAFLENMLTLYPGRSLVKNIGFDNTGTHCGETTIFDVLLTDTPISVEDIPVEKCESAYLSFKRYFQSNKIPILKKLIIRFSMIIKKCRKLWK